MNKSAKNAKSSPAANDVKAVKAAAKAATKAGPVIVKSDKDLAAERNKPQRAAILRELETAEAAVGVALLNALRMTITMGPTSKDEVAESWPSCNNPAVYASWFNLGHRAQSVVGERLTLDAIAKSCEGKGQSFKKAREALVKVIDTAKKQTGVVAGRAGCELTGRAATAAVNAAVTAAKAAAVAPKAPAAPRQPKAPTTAVLAAAAIETGKGARELGGFLRLASQQAHRMAAPSGQEGAWREALTALEDAAEKFAVFMR